jgi:small basic protein
MSAYFFTKLFFSSFFVLMFLAILVAYMSDQLQTFSARRRVVNTLVGPLVLAASAAMPLAILCGIWGF